MRSMLLILSLCAAETSFADPFVAGNVQLVSGARPRLRDTSLYTSFPSFATFDLKAEHLDASLMRGKLVLSGWGQMDPAQPSIGDAAGADLNVAFFEARLFAEDRLVMRVGRQLILGGAARLLRVDGLSVDARLVAGLGLNAWAGAVVSSPFEPRPRANFATGARAYYRFGTNHELGASFVLLRDGAGWARQDAGIDGRVRVHRMLTLSGYALWSVAAARLADLDARIAFQPVESVSMLANYRRSSPDLFLSRMSIFSVFAEQERDEAGGEIGLYPHARLTLDVTGYWLRTPAGNGYRTSGRVSGRLGSHMQTHVGVEAGTLRAPSSAALDDGYVNLRGFMRTQITEQWQLALDVANYFLSRRVNGQPNAFLASTVLSYDPTSQWRLGLSVSAGENPYFSRCVEGFLRVTYRFAAGSGS